MDPDLKSMMHKVIAARGTKTYHYAFATGQRKDGRGAGHLVIDTKRVAPLRAGRDSPLDEVKISVTGRCWSDEQDTVFFSGRGMQQTVLDKLRKAYRHLTGGFVKLELPEPIDARTRDDQGDVEDGDDGSDKGAGGDTLPADTTVAKAEAAGDGSVAADDPSARHAAELLDGLREPLDHLKRTDPTRATKFAAVMLAAQQELAKGQFGKALVLLQGVGKALEAARPTQEHPAAEQAPEQRGNVAAARLRLELKALHLEAVKALGELTKKVKAESDPRAGHVADIVRRLARDIPGGMEQALQQLENATREGDTASVSAAKARVRQATGAWLSFLQSNAGLIRACESNPWRVTLPLGAPARSSLGAALQMTR